MRSSGPRTPDSAPSTRDLPPCWSAATCRDAQRRADGVARGQLPPPSDVGRGGPRRALHRRRRPRVPRLQHRRHVDVLRLRAGAARPRRLASGSPAATSSSCPTEDAIVVSEELSRRFGLPKWQYTSSATQANTEAIRVARVVTGREKVLAVRRQVPRAPRRDAGRAGRRTGGWSPRSAACRQTRSRGPPLSRSTTSQPCAGAGAAGYRAGADRARDHQQHRPPPARRGVPRASSAADPGGRARSWRIDETHTQVVGPGGLAAAVGPPSRTSSRPASPSPAACRSAPGA